MLIKMTKTGAALLVLGAMLLGCQRAGQSPAEESVAAYPSAPPVARAHDAHTSAGAEVKITPPVATTTPAPALAAPETPPQVSAGTKPFVFQTPAGGPAAVTGSCSFAGLDGIGEYKLFAAGAYSGRRLGFPIDDSGNEAGRFDVAVNHPGQPVVLMLGSYDPAVWHVGWTAGTRIAAVLVSGYHQQVITGLPKDVPVLVSTYDNRGPCQYFYVTAEKARTLNPIARGVFGRNVDLVYPANQGRVVIGAPVQGAALVTDSSAREDAAFRIADSRAGGKFGLDYAISQGWLREARRSDTDAWLHAYQRQESSDVPPIAGGRPAGRMSVHNGYVVLKSFALPPGLYGGHSATFFVPKGVQRPTGELGHSTLYDFNTMTCRGTMCGH